MPARTRAHELEQRHAASLEHLQRAGAYAEKAGVTLLLENLNHEPDDAEVHYMGHSIEELKVYFDAISPSALMWGASVNHMHLLPGDFDSFIDAFGVERIGLILVADNRGMFEEHLLPGQGTMDFSRLFKRLEGDGYRGPYMLTFGNRDQKSPAVSISSRKRAPSGARTSGARGSSGSSGWPGSARCGLPPRRTDRRANPDTDRAARRSCPARTGHQPPHRASSLPSRSRTLICAERASANGRPFRWVSLQVPGHLADETRCRAASIHRSPGRVTFVQIVSSSPSGLKIWMRSFSRSQTKTRPSVCTQTLCGRLNWPGSVPGSPHDWSSSPSAEKRWMRALP